MITTIDKAIVAILTGLGFVLGNVLGLDFFLGLTDATYATIASIVVGLLTWLVPNKAVTP